MVKAQGSNAREHHYPGLCHCEERMRRSNLSHAVGLYSALPTLALDPWPFDYFGGNTATHLHEFISQLSMKSM